MANEQISLFEFMYDEFKIKKPIRLIELFSGIGAQAKALEELGADFEHWKTCDWAVPSIHAYAAIHGFHLWGNPDSKYGWPRLDREARLSIVEGVSTNYNEPMKRKQLEKKSDEWINALIENIGKTNNLVNIMDVHADDLEIRERDKYCYIMTYSFPCQDLSLAGHKKGMAVSQANGGTRSGLLWEVERILKECQSNDCLPQVLLMENVPEVVSSKNIREFRKWHEALDALGYSSYCEILNAKDYGLPQNRRRCFMVSILGEYNFTFPRKMKTQIRLIDFLEEEVEEKYYLSQKAIDFFLFNTQKQAENGNGFAFKPISSTDEEAVARTITTRSGSRMDDNFIFIKNKTKDGFLKAGHGDGIDISTRMQYHRGTVQPQRCQTITTFGGENVGVCINEVKLVGGIGEKKSNGGTQYYEQNRIYDANGVATAIPTSFHPYYLNNLTIRKLTPLECLKLMGFEEYDYNRLREIGQSDAQIYHEAGDSICVTVLMSIFGKMLDLPYEGIIDEYVNLLKKRRK